MFKSIKFGALLAGAVVALLASAPSHAALVPTTPACTNGGALTAMQPDAVACLGAFSGNDANQQADVLTAITNGFNPIVGDGLWSLTEKVDAGGTGSVIQNVPGATSGNIAFTTAFTDYFALILKASNQFSIYLFDGNVAPISSVDFTTIGASVNGKGKAQELSHATLYSVKIDDENPSEVPIPAGILLLGSGIALVGFMRRRA